MKKNIISVVLSVFVFISAVSIATPVFALTDSELSALIEQLSNLLPQSNISNDSGNSALVNIMTNSNNYNCANLVYDLGYTYRDSIDNGNSITILQKFLNKNNYLQVTPTGYFGNLTLQAVKAFQAANGINTNGRVGPATRAAIKSLDCGNANIITSISNTNSSQNNNGPTITLSAYPSTVEVGTSTKLTWSSYDSIDQCKISFKDSAGTTFSSNIGTSGNINSGPINNTTTFTIVCYNKYGIPGSKSLTVRVANPVPVTTQIEYPHSPYIISAIPSSGKIGDIITINGSGFTSNDEIYLGGVKVDNNLITSQSSTSVIFVIPEYKLCISDYCPPPNYDTNIETGGDKIIQISNVNGFSNDYVFKLASKIITIKGINQILYSAKLTLDSINPITGNRGDAVTLAGSGFTSDNIVLFGGFKVDDKYIFSKSNSKISFIVPPFQMGCTQPEFEVCPKLPFAGNGTTIETGGPIKVSVMDITSKSTTTSLIFTLPSKTFIY